MPGPAKVTYTPLALFLAIVIVVANCGGAWYVISKFEAKITAPLTSNDKDGTINRSLELLTDATPGTVAYLERLLRAELMSKLISNRQMIIVVAIAMAFGLIAVGFALFVMGVEGAIKFEGEAGPFGRFALQGTYPGLLCFLLAAVIISTAVLQQLQLDFGEFHVDSGPVSVAYKQPEDPVKKQAEALSAIKVRPKIEPIPEK